MSGVRVLLMRLSCRTSGKGTEYLSGFLGAARVVAFKAKEPDKFGNEQWEVYAQEAEPQSPTRNAQRGQAGWDRYREQQRRDAQGRAQQAGEVVLATAGRTRAPELAQDLVHVTDAAIHDLTGHPR